MQPPPNAVGCGKIHVPQITFAPHLLARQATCKPCVSHSVTTHLLQLRTRCMASTAHVFNFLGNSRVDLCCLLLLLLLLCDVPIHVCVATSGV